LKNTKPSFPSLGAAAFFYGISCLNATVLNYDHFHMSFGLAVFVTIVAAANLAAAVTCPPFI